MIILKGRVSKGWGNSSRNFKHIEEKIAGVMGLPKLCSGTLNVEMDTPFPFIEKDRDVFEGFISKEEYNQRENIYLKRCRINELECLIIRPDDHFCVEKFKRRAEIMSPYKLRDKLNLKDNDFIEVEIKSNENQHRVKE